MKLFMMPHTVPNRPTNGDVEPMVASRPRPRRTVRPSLRMISAKEEAARSFTPSSEAASASCESCASSVAADRKVASTLRRRPTMPCASCSVRAAPIRTSDVLRLRRAVAISTDFAISTVQVTSEAKARLHITNFTMMSAERNIDQGESSWPARPPIDPCGGALGSSVGAAASGTAVAGAADGDACAAAGDVDDCAASGVASANAMTRPAGIRDRLIRQPNVE